MSQIKAVSKVMAKNDNALLHDEERQFREHGPWSRFSVDIVVPFYNEEKNLEKAHEINRRLERLFHIKNYVYVANGPTDGTRERLRELQLRETKVKVVDVEQNQGYGYGMRQGLKAATADYVLTNHADVQFEPYSFFMTHLLLLQSLPEPKAIFPRRTNRPTADAVTSTVLRGVVRACTGRAVSDFNGQPKLLPRAKLTELDALPKDFCLDLALYVKFTPEETVSLPVLQAARFAGVSSWNKNPFSRFRQAWRYVKFSASQIGR